MKKLLILSITFFTLLSCSSESEKSISQDLIISTWSSFSDDGIERNDCGKRSTLTFNNNNTFTTDGSYIEDQGKCIKDGTDIPGTWHNKGNNIYNLKFDKKENEVNLKATFSDSNNTVTFIIYNADGSIKETTVHKRK